MSDPILTKRVDGVPLDQYLDPITLDYVDTDDGEWLETADSRTAVLIQCEQRLGKAWDRPGDGTDIKDLLESGDPLTPEIAAAETARALQLMVNDGEIADLSVGPVRDERGNIIVDETGRPVINTSWHDLASSDPITITTPAVD